MQVNEDRKNARENVWRRTQRKEGASNEKVKWQLPRSMAKKPKHLSLANINNFLSAFFPEMHLDLGKYGKNPCSHEKIRFGKNY